MSATKGNSKQQWFSDNHSLATQLTPKKPRLAMTKVIFKANCIEPDEWVSCMMTWINQTKNFQNTSYLWKLENCQVSSFCFKLEGENREILRLNIAASRSVVCSSIAICGRIHDQPRKLWYYWVFPLASEDEEESVVEARERFNAYNNPNKSCWMLVARCVQTYR